MKTKNFECHKSIRNYEKKNIWNFGSLVDKSFVPWAQRTSVLYCRLSDFCSLSWPWWLWWSRRIMLAAMKKTCKRRHLGQNNKWCVHPPTESDYFYPPISSLHIIRKFPGSNLSISTKNVDAMLHCKYVDCGVLNCVPFSSESSLYGLHLIALNSPM